MSLYKNPDIRKKEWREHLIYIIGVPAVCYEGIHGYNSEMQAENVKILHLHNSLIISGQKALESNDDFTRVI